MANTRASLKFKNLLQGVDLTVQALVAEPLTQPSLLIADNTLTIIDESGGKAEQYDIYVDNIYKTTIDADKN